MLLPKILPQVIECVTLENVTMIIAASYLIKNRIFYYVCLLPEMTAIQVTVDKNILFILQTFSLIMTHLYVTVNNFTKVKQYIIQLQL